LETQNGALPRTRTIGRAFWSLVVAVFLGWGVIFSAATVKLISNAYQDFENGKIGDTDFRGFYFGAETLLSDNYSATYERDSIIIGVLGATNIDTSEFTADKQTWLIYYNPPAFLLMMAPLTLLERSQAFLVGVAANVLITAGLALLLGRALGWRRQESAFLVLALLSFLPTYASIYHVQPTLLIALAMLAAFMALEGGKRVLVGALLSVAVLKPHWVVLCGGAALRNSPPVVAPLFAACSLMAFLPFLILGLDVLLDYKDLLLHRGATDLEEGAFASRNVNWSGFFADITGSAQPLAALVASLLTVVAFACVLLNGDRSLSWAAAIFTTVLVVPHLHSQDWVMAVPAAAILLMRPMRPRARAFTLILLLAGYLGVNASGIEGRTAILWAVPCAFFLVLWCAALPVVERCLELHEHESATGPSEARATFAT
jgi:hypothetical protein